MRASLAFHRAEIDLVEPDTPAGHELLFKHTPAADRKDPRLQLIGQLLKNLIGNFRPTLVGQDPRLRSQPHPKPSRQAERIVAGGLLELLPGSQVMQTPQKLIAAELRQPIDA